MNQEYRLDREYSIAEIIQCNLRKWWLALICAAVCAAVLGGYKYKSLKPFIEQSVYENVKQVSYTVCGRLQHQCLHGAREQCHQDGAELPRV